MTKAQHVALLKGDPSLDGPITVRMHAFNLFTDTVVGQRSSGRGGGRDADDTSLTAARGIVVLREPLTLVSEQRGRAGETIAPASQELRDYDIGAQIFSDLGVREMVLLTNGKKSMVSLESFYLKVIGQTVMRS